MAYSGGLDTSVCVKWLKEKGYDVICFVADLGQGGDFGKIEKKALATGASKVYVEDMKEEFINDYIYPALKANAIYESKYLLATALGRPLIAQGLVSVARKERAKFVAHGCTGKGNDQVRIEVSCGILAPDIEIIAPVREWEFKSREEEIEYAKAHNIPVEATKKKPYSIDRNLWGISIECGVLEDPWKEPPEDAYQMSVSPESAPNAPTYITLDFAEGIPVKLNGANLKPQKLIERLNEIGGANGIGRSDLIENRLVGIKSREVYEAPAGTIFHIAHKELEALVLDRELAHFKEGIAQKYAELIYYGLWFTPFKAGLDAFVNETQKNVTGTVKMKLHKGKAVAVARKSPHSLYNKELATYTKDKFNQKLAEGFIKLWGLPYKR